MSEAKQVAKETASKLNWLRAAVLGANDGIVSVAGVVVGVAAVNVNAINAILTAGMAALVAGALSMAAGEYVSVSTQRDTERAVVEEKRRLLAENPDEGIEELTKIYMETGLSHDVARQVAAQYSAKDAVAAHVSAQYGLDAEDFTNPWHAAISSAISFILGAAIPLAAIMLLPRNIAIPGTFVATLAALAIAGYVSARLGNAPRLRATIRVITGGAIAMIITGGVGHFLGVNL